MHRLITDSETLAALCKKLSSCEFITVDTEFLREKTYYPKLCLVQVAGPEDDVAIDPLADGIDLQPLFDLLANESVVKVFHAAQQDVEIFYKLMGSVPSPLYDTQIAGMVCGFGESVGYEALVNNLMQESLDKASRYTDWEQRPLTQRQIDYAIADVTHLRGVYQALKKQIEEEGRCEWISEEMARMNDASQYDVDPNNSWKRLKYKNRSPAYLNTLRAAAAWRERAAQRKDVPRGRLLKDEVILQVASQSPKNIEEMAQVRGAMRHLSADNAKALIKALEEARATPKEQFPKDEKRKKLLTPEQDAVVDVLKMLLKLQCEKHHVAAKLIANKEDLAALVVGKDMPKCANGWRHDVFGKAALSFIKGELSLKVGGKNNALLFEEG